jgi:hypothetical protein
MIGSIVHNKYYVSSLEISKPQYRYTTPELFLIFKHYPPSPVKSVRNAAPGFSLGDSARFPGEHPGKRPYSALLMANMLLTLMSLVCPKKGFLHKVYSIVYAEWLRDINR